MSDNFIAQPANPHFLRFTVQLFDFTCAYLRADEAEGACDQLMAVARDAGIGTTLPDNLADPASVRNWWLKVVSEMLVDERTIGHTNQTSYDLTDTAVMLLRVAMGTSAITRYDLVHAIREHHHYDYVDDEDTQTHLRDAFGDDYHQYYDRLMSYDDAREQVLNSYIDSQLDDDVHREFTVVGDGEYVIERY